jgi:hypothetical protein
MLKSFRLTATLLAMLAALAAPAYPQQSPKPQESPWAVRAPAALPQGAPTLSALEAAAQKEAEKGTPEQQAFAHKVASAMYSKDFAAMKQLIAPSTLKCIGKNQDFLEDRIKRQLQLPISRNYKLTITKLQSKVLTGSKFATYPLPPTYLMGMQFTAEDGNNDTVNLPIGQENGEWYESQPCPTALGMERFAKLQQMRATERERAKAAATQVKDPVKSQLLALIGKHDNIAAWRVCMASTHYDFPTCRGVVAILGGDPNY